MRGERELRDSLAGANPPPLDRNVERGAGSLIGEIPICVFALGAGLEEICGAVDSHG